MNMEEVAAKLKRGEQLTPVDVLSAGIEHLIAPFEVQVAQALISLIEAAGWKLVRIDDAVWVQDKLRESIDASNEIVAAVNCAAEAIKVARHS